MSINFKLDEAGKFTVTLRGETFYAVDVMSVLIHVANCYEVNVATLPESIATVLKELGLIKHSRTLGNTAVYVMSDKFTKFYTEYVNAYLAVIKSK